ncbi:hypothetical protein [Actinoplanes sp. ATCC 53533]|uniref:hypothetical protein n=1 Tax=Actinoplanes sp. ATCC 53533 TaxID=1288362 RepID=UPI000F79ADEC|nr:hypothetical protein [Actinoplanes sp. ATCC 53533]
MILPWQGYGDDRDPGWCVGPVPVADPDEEHARGAERARRAAGAKPADAVAGPDGQPDPEVVDMPAADVSDEPDLG